MPAFKNTTHGRLPPIYNVRKMRRSMNVGVTKPVFGELNAILKFDGIESPHCVYSEYVAKTLANILQIPIADGVLVPSIDGPAYASLEVAVPGISLPDLYGPSLSKVAEKYPDAVAAILAFDTWIGNRDRSGNIKASIVSTHVPLFIGFDHSHALLNIESTPTKSIRRLREGELIIDNHPLIGLVEPNKYSEWLSKIHHLPDEYIDNCCKLGRPFRSVSTRIQSGLSNALKKRRESFSEFIALIIFK